MRIRDFTDGTSNTLCFSEVKAFTPYLRDGDGASNHLDLDSDEDGINDLVEAGGDDLNDDGLVDAWTDSDEDGIVDAADIDLTGGEDADGDGIDDFADADFVALADTDGDGIVDLFDSDPEGSGFQPITVSGEPLQAADFLDGDGNGVIDVLEPNPAGAGQDEIIRTGLEGVGCSINTSGGGSQDPLLPLLGLLAAGGVMMRSRQAKRVVN
jgi:hypothetical protein